MVKMVVYLSFFLLFFAFTICVHTNECHSSKCGSKGPLVRFPFRIQGKQPRHCGYPQHRFVLSCSENDDTLLQLTPSLQLFIKEIDYKAQLISAYDSEGCLTRKLLNFNLSGSSFQFNIEYYYNFTLFNCSSAIQYDSNLIPCLSDPHNAVYAIASDEYISDYLHLLSCTKIHDMSGLPYRYVLQQENILELSWSDPKCRSCETKGKYCRLQSNITGSKTECYAKLKPGATLGSILLVGALVMSHWLYSSNKMDREYQSKMDKFLDDYKSFKPSRFSFADIKRMTNEFKDELGQGAYGTVYKGKLSHEIMVAVKVLSNSKGNGEEFVNEVGTIGRIHHVNVVRLFGFCADGFRRALVYEYLPNDSLQKFISSSQTKSPFLGWRRLKDISLGIAKGIDYLHQGCDQRILHFDIKPQNILLDHDFNPKVSDFGLAKLCGKDQSAVSMTTAKGTIGYMAPEVFSRNFGNVSYKSDVYSFGMLVLEMVGGRKIGEERMGNDEEIYYPEWIYNLLEEGEDLRLEIEEDGDAKIAKKLAIVGLWCIQWNPMERPSMRTVVQILEGEGENLAVPPNPFSSAVSARKNAKMPQRRLHLELEIISETE
ncbi:rust resistance kinase Lr10-like isoform X2 [Euphorbia lathyris]|uniref:rust resistance kinase Lr10-like isoform X2 n=1 Tax=Euphorbia lathyris TaxID=212925 RepID=UPI003313AAF5